jgi:hypothetical protein
VHEIYRRASGAATHHCGEGQSPALEWLGISSLTVAVHVTDEALTGFLSIYNPTVIALRRQLGLCPIPTFEFRVWLVGLFTAILVGIAVTPLLFRNLPWIRPTGYFVALFAGIFNALGHTIATVLGIRFAQSHSGAQPRVLLLAVPVCCRLLSDCSTTPSEVGDTAVLSVSIINLSG